MAEAPSARGPPVSLSTPRNNTQAAAAGMGNSAGAPAPEAALLGDAATPQQGGGLPPSSARRAGSRRPSFLSRMTTEAEAEDSAEEMTPKPRAPKVALVLETDTPESASDVHATPTSVPSTIRKSDLLKRTYSTAKALHRPTASDDAESGTHPGRENHRCPWYVIDPNTSEFRKYWDLVLGCIIFYNSVVVPFRIAFEVELDPNFAPYWVEFVLDMLFVVDIVLNFFTGVNDGGVMVYRPSRIAKVYLQGWFFLDLLSAMPFDLIFTAAGLGKDAEAASRDSTATATSQVGEANKLLKMLKTIRLLRMLRLARLARILQRMRHYLGLKYSITTIAKFLFFIVCVAHWCGCLWAFVASMEDDNFNWMTQTVLVTGPAPEDTERLSDATLGTRYLVSLYHSIMVMATIGTNIEPVTDEERVLSLVVMGIGASTFAYGLTNMCSLMYNLNTSEVSHMHRIDEVADFLSTRGISIGLRVKVMEYFEFLKNHMKSSEHDNIVSALTPSLAGQVIFELNSTMILKNAFFKDMPQAFVIEVLKRLHIVTYAPGDVVINEGDKGKCMYFISEGIVEVYLESLGGRVITELRAGDFVGEIALIDADAERSASVRAVTFCDIYSLSKDHIDEVLQVFPDCEKRWHRIAHSRLEDLKRRKKAQKGTSFTQRALSMVSGASTRDLRRVSQDSEGLGDLQPSKRTPLRRSKTEVLVPATIQRTSSAPSPPPSVLREAILHFDGEHSKDSNSGSGDGNTPLRSPSPAVTADDVVSMAQRHLRTRLSRSMSMRRPSLGSPASNPNIYGSMGNFAEPMGIALGEDHSESGASEGRARSESEFAAVAPSPSPFGSAA